MASSCATMILQMSKYSLRSTLGVSAYRTFSYQLRCSSVPRRAPPHILNVVPGQPVELRVVKRLQDDFIPPKRKAFSGHGHRLGSPVPGTPTGVAESSAIPGSFPPSASSSSSSQAAPRSAETFGTRFEVDQTKPTTSVQIRLADGSRLVARMNLTHTVGDIRNFINAYVPGSLRVEYLH